MGWVAEFLSKPIVTGFVLGLTILVIIGELPNILGIPVRPPPTSQGASRTSSSAWATSTADRRGRCGLAGPDVRGHEAGPEVPWALVTLMFGLIASNILDFAADGVRVVGTCPRGCPRLHCRGSRGSDWAQIVLAGAAVAFVGLAEGLSAARLYATEDARVDASQELLAVGAGNVARASSGVSAWPGACPRPPPSTGLVGVAGGWATTAAFALATILVLAPPLSGLPKAPSAIVIHAVWGLLDFKSMRRYAYLRINDLIAATVAALGVLVFGPLQGLLLAITLSVFGLVYRSSRVDVEVMGRIPGEKAGWGGMRNHPERTTIPGLLVLRINVSLFWVNAAGVQEVILEAVDAEPETKALILDLEASHQLGVTTADMLSETRDQLAERNVDLYLVRLHWPVRKVLARSGLRARLGEDHLWHGISQAVRVARRRHGIARAGHPEAEPVLVDDAEDVEVVEDEIVATPEPDDLEESDAPRRRR